MRTQDADAVLRQLRQELFKINKLIQKQEKMIEEVQTNMDSFTNAEESIEEMVNSNIESYEIRNELRQVIKEVEEKIIRIRIEEQIAQSIQFTTIQELKDEYDESTVEMGIVKPKSVGMTIQEIKPSRNMKLSELQIYDPEDVDIFYDALPHLDNQGQVSKDYEDNFSLQNSTKVTAMEAAHPVGTKRNQKQHRGHQASRKRKTSLNLTAIELQQLRPYTKYKKQQIPSKKPQLYKRIKRADIDAINVKIKNYKPLLNLLRLLVHYII